MPTNNVHRRLDQAMTVEQLKERLEGLDDKTVIVFVCDYGDHGHTQQALPVWDVNTFPRTKFDETAYSRSGIEYLTDKDKDEETDVPDEDSIEGTEEDKQLVLVMW